MHYRTKDGAEFEADNERHVVRELRKSAFAKSANEQEFMREVARGAYMLFSKRIPTNSHHAFVQGLLREGLLEEVHQPSALEQVDNQQ
jgi:hypothetical protein